MAQPVEPDGPDEPGGPRLSRRRILGWGIGGVALAVAAGATGVELVAHGVLPGQQALDQLDGTCSVDSPPPTS